MTTTEQFQTFLADAQVDRAVFDLRPDYRALLLIVSGIPSGSSDETSESLLRHAESQTRHELEQRPVTDFAHVAAWREAYKAFGVKPNKFRNSLEALTRRVPQGLPRVNRLTDIYNALSVKHQIPMGGEDITKYTGPPRLVRSDGSEQFDTTSNGVPIIEKPDAGEVVWRDGAGVTCRRWNWRQGTRTALADDTAHVLFIFDALDPVSNDDLVAAADELVAILKGLSPDVWSAQRIIQA